MPIAMQFYSELFTQNYTLRETEPPHQGFKNDMEVILLVLELTNSRRWTQTFFRLTSPWSNSWQVSAYKNEKKYIRAAAMNSLNKQQENNRSPKTKLEKFNYSSKYLR